MVIIQNVGREHLGWGSVPEALTESGERTILGRSKLDCITVPLNSLPAGASNQDIIEVARGLARADEDNLYLFDNVKISREGDLSNVELLSYDNFDNVS